MAVGSMEYSDSRSLFHWSTSVPISFMLCNSQIIWSMVKHLGKQFQNSPVHCRNGTGISMSKISNVERTFKWPTLRRGHLSGIVVQKPLSLVGLCHYPRHATPPFKMSKAVFDMPSEDGESCATTMSQTSTFETWGKNFAGWIFFFCSVHYKLHCQHHHVIDIGFWNVGTV